MRRKLLAVALTGSVILALWAVVAVSAKTAFTYRTERRVVKACNLLLPLALTGPPSTPAANPNAYFFVALERSPQKPRGWTFDNPLASEVVTPAISTRWVTPGYFTVDPDIVNANARANLLSSGGNYWNGITNGASADGLTPTPPYPMTLTKRMPQYWEVVLTPKTAPQIADFDVIYCALPAGQDFNAVYANADGTFTDLNPYLQEAVDRGALLWLDNVGSDGAKPDAEAGDTGGIDPFFVNFIFGDNPPRRLVAADTQHPVLNSLFALAPSEVNALGRRGALAGDANANEDLGKYVEDYPNPPIEPDDKVVKRVVNAINGGNVNAAILGGRQGDGAVLVTAPYVGRHVQDWFLRAFSGPTDWHKPDLKFAFNAMDWAGQYELARRGPRGTGSRVASAPGPLDIAWQFPTRLETDYSIAAVVCSPVVSRGRVFVTTLRGSNLTGADLDHGLVICLDAHPGTDLDGNGVSDDGMSDINGDGVPDDFAAGRGHDVVWIAHLPSGFTPRNAGPAVATITPPNAPPRPIVIAPAVKVDGSEARLFAYQALSQNPAGQPENAWTVGPGFSSFAPYDPNGKIINISTPAVSGEYVYFVTTEYSPAADGNAGVDSIDDIFSRVWCVDVQTGGDVGGPGRRFVYPDPSKLGPASPVGGYSCVNQPEHPHVLAPMDEPEWALDVVANGVGAPEIPPHTSTMTNPAEERRWDTPGMVPTVSAPGPNLDGSAQQPVVGLVSTVTPENYSAAPGPAPPTGWPIVQVNPAQTNRAGGSQLFVVPLPEGGDGTIDPAFAGHFQIQLQHRPVPAAGNVPAGPAGGNCRIVDEEFEVDWAAPAGYLLPLPVIARPGAAVPPGDPATRTIVFDPLAARSFVGDLRVGTASPTPPQRVMRRPEGRWLKITYTADLDGNLGTVGDRTDMTELHLLPGMIRPTLEIPLRNQISAPAETVPGGSAVMATGIRLGDLVGPGPLAYEKPALPSETTAQYNSGMVYGVDLRESGRRKNPSSDGQGNLIPREVEWTYDPRAASGGAHARWHLEPGTGMFEKPGLQRWDARWPVPPQTPADPTDDVALEQVDIEGGVAVRGDTAVVAFNNLYLDAAVRPDFGNRAYQVGGVVGLTTRPVLAIRLRVPPGVSDANTVIESDSAPKTLTGGAPHTVPAVLVTIRPLFTPVYENFASAGEPAPADPTGSPERYIIPPRYYDIDYRTRTIKFKAELASNVWAYPDQEGAAAGAPPMFLGPIYGRPVYVSYRYSEYDPAADTWTPGTPVGGTWAGGTNPFSIIDDLHVVPNVQRWQAVPGIVRLQYYPLLIDAGSARGAKDITANGGWIRITDVNGRDVSDTNFGKAVADFTITDIRDLDLGTIDFSGRDGSPITNAAGGSLMGQEVYIHYVGWDERSGRWVRVGNPGVSDETINSYQPSLTAPGVASNARPAMYWPDSAPPTNPPALGAEKQAVTPYFGAPITAPTITGNSVHVGTAGLNRNERWPSLPNPHDYLFEYPNDNWTIGQPPAGALNRWHPVASRLFKTLLTVNWDPASKYARAFLSQPARCDLPPGTAVGGAPAGELVPIVRGAPAAAEDSVYVGVDLVRHGFAALPSPSRGYVSALRNPRTLICDRHRILKTAAWEPDLMLTGTTAHLQGEAYYLSLDGTQSVVGPAQVFNSPAKATGLPNGNILIVDTSNDRVVEVDQRGKQVWPLDPAGNDLYASSYNTGLSLNEPSDAYRFYFYNTAPVPAGPARMEAHTVIADTGNRRVIRVITWTEVVGSKLVQNHQVIVESPAVVPQIVLPGKTLHFVELEYTKAQPIFDWNWDPASGTTQRLMGYLCTAANLHTPVVIEARTRVVDPPASSVPPTDGALPGTWPTNAPTTTDWSFLSWLYDPNGDGDYSDRLMFDNLKDIKWSRERNTGYVTITASNYPGWPGAPATAEPPGVWEFSVGLTPGGAPAAAPIWGGAGVGSPTWFFTGYDYHYDSTLPQSKPNNFRPETNILINPGADGVWRAPEPYDETSADKDIILPKHWEPVACQRLNDGDHLIVNRGPNIEGLTHYEMPNRRPGPTSLGSEVFEVRTIPTTGVHYLVPESFIPAPRERDWTDPFNQPSYAERLD